MDIVKRKLLLVTIDLSCLTGLLKGKQKTMRSYLSTCNIFLKLLIKFQAMC